MVFGSIYCGAHFVHMSKQYIEYHAAVLSHYCICTNVILKLFDVTNMSIH